MITAEEKLTEQDDGFRERWIPVAANMDTSYRLSSVEGGVYYIYPNHDSILERRLGLRDSPHLSQVELPSLNKAIEWAEITKAASPSFVIHLFVSLTDDEKHMVVEIDVTQEHIDRAMNLPENEDNLVICPMSLALLENQGFSNAHCNEIALFFTYNKIQYAIDLDEHCQRFYYDFLDIVVEGDRGKTLIPFSIRQLSEMDYGRNLLNVIFTNYHFVPIYRRIVL